jgi:CheY-like chemotaxis protein
VEASPHTSEQVPDSGPFAGSLVLCLDNEVSILEGMRALLEGWSCDVLIATSLAAAKAALASSTRSPDVVLADYHLDDGITGVEALARLNAGRQVPMPGIVITADYTEAVRDEAIEHGHHFMRKPIKPAQLRALLASVLGGA